MTEGDTSGYHAVKHPSRELKGNDLTEYRLKVLESHIKQGLANDAQIIGMLGEQKTQFAVALNRLDAHSEKITKAESKIDDPDRGLHKVFSTSKEAVKRVEGVEKTQTRAGWFLIGALIASLGALVTAIFGFVASHLPGAHP